MIVIIITTFLNAYNVSDTELGYCTFINFHDADTIIFPILLKRGWDSERLSKLCKINN